MRRIIAHNNTLHHYHSVSIPTLFIPPHINPNNKYSFSTTNNQSTPKKPKIKISQDEYDEFDENTEEMEEATIQKETKQNFKQTASPTISNIKFSDDERENKSYRSKFAKYIAINIGLDNILPRMIALRDKDPEAITKAMNTFWIGNVMSGIPFFLLCWQCSHYIIYPELILAYLIMRYSANYVPGSNINKTLVDVYKIKYPLLKECNWSRKVPDPTRQSVDAFAHNITTKIPLLQRVEAKLPSFMKDFRQRVYSNTIKHGFAWDIADNTRIIIGLPLLCGLLHYGGIGLYIADMEVYSPIFAKWACVYIGAAYGARITSNWALRTMVLTVIEKRFGLRSESGDYYGYKKKENVNRKGTMGGDNDEEYVRNAKVSSRKPKKM